MLDYIAQLLKDFLAALISWFWYWFSEVCSFFTGVVLAFIQSTINNLGLDVTQQWTYEFYSKLNFFFPVSETFGILGVLFMNWLVILTLKILLKLFPGIY